MPITWERDSGSGINKEISDQYAVAPFMPGATMIPSASPGDFGGQRGQDPEEPFVQIIDPYEAGGGQVLDMRPRYQHKKTQRKSAAPDRGTATDQLLALGRVMTEQQYPVPQFPTAQQQQQWPGPPQYGQPAAPMMPVGAPSPMGLAGMQGDSSLPTDTDMSAAQPGYPPAPVYPSMPALPPMRHIPPPVRQQQAAPQMAPAPAVQPMEVQFHMPDGSQFVCYYHAIVKPENQPHIVLVTDLRASGFMQRFIPPLSVKGAPMGLVVPSHNLTLYVYSIGIQFRFDNREYLVLVVDERTPANGEDRTAGAGSFPM